MAKSTIQRINARRITTGCGSFGVVSSLWLEIGAQRRRYNQWF
jgi:hypothetical protein